MPDNSSLLVERDPNGIVALTINRPHVRNALDWPTMTAFGQAVSALAAEAALADGALRAVIVTGAGSDAFCSGGDLRDLANDTTEADGERLAAEMGGALAMLEALPVPVIAAINGYALGGGCEIALACDLRIVDERAQVGLVHLRLAIIPAWGGAQRLLRHVGYARALDMLLAARPYGAAELLSFGLANAVVPPASALPAARALAARIASADPGAVRAAKAALRAGLTMTPGDALAAERALLPRLWAGQAHWAEVERRVGGWRVAGLANESDTSTDASARGPVAAGAGPAPNRGSTEAQG